MGARGREKARAFTWTRAIDQVEQALGAAQVEPEADPSKVSRVDDDHLGAKPPRLRPHEAELTLDLLAVVFLEDERRHARFVGRHVAAGPLEQARQRRRLGGNEPGVDRDACSGKERDDCERPTRTPLLPLHGLRSNTR
jgi:hypothetical protein